MMADTTNNSSRVKADLFAWLRGRILDRRAILFMAAFNASVRRRVLPVGRILSKQSAALAELLFKALQQRDLGVLDALPGLG